MKAIKTVFALGMSALLLASCGSSFKEVSFADFQKAVAEKPEAEVEKFAVKGDYLGTAVDFSSDKENLTEIEMGIIVTLGVVTVDVIAAEEVSGATYYTGDGFKVAAEQEGAKAEYEFDKYGNCTYLFQEQGEMKAELKVTYTYKA